MCLDKICVQIIAGCLVIVSVFGTDRLLAAQQTDPQPVLAQNGTTLGYIHRFAPSVPAKTIDRAAPPIVYLPGFDLDLAELINPERSVRPGTRASGLRLARKLVLVNTELHKGSDSQFLEYVVDELGHNVYILEYADADAGIEANALAVQTLLTDARYPIKTRYQSDGVRALVLGWSMGGLIGRYALTELEYQGSDHNSSMFISFDAPHQGAYLPLALEAFVGLTREAINKNDFSDDLVEFNNLLVGASTKYNARSAKQMLALHIGKDDSENFSTTMRRRYAQMMNNPNTQSAHQDFYSVRDKLRFIGDYPANVRNVAISNGNALGNSLPLPLPRNGNELIRLSASVPVTSRYNVELLDIRLFEDTAKRRRANCSITLFFEKTNCAAFQMPVVYENLSASAGSYTNVVSRLASAFSSQSELKQEWQNLGYSIQFDADVPAGEGRTTFIAIQSALDIRKNTLAPQNDALALQTPFDAVYANPALNLPHNAVSESTVSAITLEMSNHRLQQRSEQVLSAILF